MKETEREITKESVRKQEINKKFEILLMCIFSAAFISSFVRTMILLSEVGSTKFMVSAIFTGVSAAVIFIIAVFLVITSRRLKADKKKLP